MTTTEYLGETVQVTDAESHVTQTRYNAAGQIDQVTDADSHTATYTYKPFGELASMTDAESNTTTIGYDARGFKSSMSDPNMGDWDYEYDIYGQLVSQTNALNEETTLDYDEAGRLTERDEDEGTTTWSYNAYNASAGARGKLDSISAPDSYAEAYSYYTTGAYIGQPAWVRRTIDSTDYYFNMYYDSSYGRLTELKYPTSTSGYRFDVKYEYDAYGQLQYVKDGNETYTYYTLNSTDALGRERSVSLGNGRTETRDYDDAAGYIKTIQTSGSTQDLAFTYDEVGNVLTKADNLISETETYTYDSLNRLATSQVSGESQVTIAYSNAGRITSKTGVGSYTYGAGGAGPFAVTSANGLSYTYDANGRMVTRGSDDITWYSFDKPKKIENGSDSSEFWYGPDRARYRQDIKLGGVLDARITYVGMLFEFEDAATDTYRHYVQAGDRVVAMVRRVGTTNTKEYLHRDNQGSVTKVTNAGGSVIESLAYDAWGLRRDPTDWSALTSPFSGSHETERGYTGHEHLDTVGLIHMNGRVQDPVLGRFISADPTIQAPYSTQSHNRYAYVWNNPTSLTDPSGFCTEGSALAGYNLCIEDMLEGYEAFTDRLTYLQDYEMATGISTGFMQDMAFLNYFDVVSEISSRFGNSGTNQGGGGAVPNNVPAAQRTVYVESSPVSAGDQDKLLHDSRNLLEFRLNDPANFANSGLQSQYLELFKNWTIVIDPTVNEPGLNALTRGSRTRLSPSVFARRYTLGSDNSRRYEARVLAVGRIANTLAHELRHQTPANQALGTDLEKTRALLNPNIEQYLNAPFEVDARDFARALESNDIVVSDF